MGSLPSRVAGGFCFVRATVASPVSVLSAGDTTDAGMQACRAVTTINVVGLRP